MATQLVLLPDESPSWKLDGHTRAIGRRGVAEARAALRRAHAPETPVARPSRAA